jgi:D-alanyl-lipoteichoic acid acyltransferase DltB (MBOAT superfamily)
MALRDLGDLGWLCGIWVTFLASGLWHGTGWTFLVWAGLHAAGLSVFSLTRKLRKRLQKRVNPTVVTVCSTLITFHYVCLAYVFFRAPSLTAAWTTLRSLGAGFSVTFEVNRSWNALLYYAAVSSLLDYLQLRAGELWIFRQQTWLRSVVYVAMLLSVLRLFGPSADFIYAEF